MTLPLLNIAEQALLDCTLRDGSYRVEFGFTASHTQLLCQALAKAGIRYIEVGHGVGLGASQAGYGESAETDRAYAQAAANALQGTDAYWGMFAIPGIATMDDLTMAHDQGMQFVRLGISMDQPDSWRPFIRHARQLQLLTLCNVMKSYVLPPPAFANLSAQLVDAGCHGVYVVDSAGGMHPDEVSAYCQAVRKACPETMIGFHGHNNLGLAVANALVAWQQGANLVDVSLRGLGRSAGNTPTEQFVSVLKRLDPAFDLSPLEMMGLAQRFVMPWLPFDPLDDVDMTCGLALFHSSYLPVLEAAAAQHQADLKALILAVAAEDCLNAPPDRVEYWARHLAGTGFQPLAKPYVGQEQQ